MLEQQANQRRGCRLAVRTADGNAMPRLPHQGPKELRARENGRANAPSFR